MLKEFDIS